MANRSCGIATLDFNHDGARRARSLRELQVREVNDNNQQ